MLSINCNIAKTPDKAINPIALHAHQNLSYELKAIILQKCT